MTTPPRPPTKGKPTSKDPPHPHSITTIPFPKVEDRVSESTSIWCRDLRALFEHSKDRFGDVSWESEEGGDRIWGHKAVIYARAPKAFKDRYFISRPFSRSPNGHSPIPHSLPPLFRSSPSPSSLISGVEGQGNGIHSHGFVTGSGNGAGSGSGQGGGFGLGLGLGSGNGLGLGLGFGAGTGRMGSSLSVGESFVSENTIRGGDGGFMRLTHGDTPELFRAQLEWLYTGEGFGDVVEWISAENENGSLLGGSVRDSLGRRGNLADRRDKLGQDLTYMWRSKLYADVRIHLTPQIDEESSSDSSDSSTDSLSSTAVFTSHRFILTSRSPYFASVLLNHSSFRPVTADIHLQTPPFTPAALHFCLGYLYAGHLDFSNRTFDLTTAFQIHRAAAYLQLDVLINEVESRIVHDFCHGLEKCRCKKCGQRVGRVWRFAEAPDVGALALGRRSRDYLVNFWDDCWGREVATADVNERDRLVRDVIGGITIQNVVSSYRSFDMIKGRLEYEVRNKGRARTDWVEVMEGMVQSIEAHSGHLLITKFGVIAEGTELWALVAGNGFSGDILDRVMNELVDGVGTSKGCIEGPKVYQALVSSILLKVDPETLQTALPARSRTRQTIESAKNGVLGHIRRRWMQIRDAGGFSDLENWSLKEISDEIEVPVDDLWTAGVPKVTLSRPLPRTTSRVTALSDAASLASAHTRATQSSRPSTLRPTPSITAPEPSTGLKRLRLTSSASTSSAASSHRSVAPPSTSGSTARSGLPAGPSLRPVARSPTAARPSPVVPVGSVRARVAAANRAATSSPTPSSSKTTPRPTMTGGPRPLLTRPQPNVDNGRPPSLASVKITRTARSTATTATITKPAPVKTAPSVMSKTPAKVSPLPAVKTPVVRPRSSSISTTASTRSKAASVVSKAPSTTSRSTSSKPPVPPMPKVIPKLATPKATPPTATSKVISPPATKTNTPPTPKSTPRTVFPAKSSDTTPLPSGLSAVTANRLRNLSTASTSSRTSIRPPIPKSTPTLRSPSGSTDDTQEAKTPSQSQILDPAIIIHDSTPTSQLPTHSKPSSYDTVSTPPTSKFKPPPISLTRPNRKTSTTSSTTSFSGLRPHPASAFDPPKERPKPKFPPVITITDGSKPFAGHGIALHVGVPCIVSLSQRRVRFKANIRYIGQLAGTRGAWVGIELDHQDRLDIKTLTSGSKDGVHYFHLSPPSVEDLNTSHGDPIRQARRRKIDVITESLRRSPVKSMTMGGGVVSKERSGSPFLQDWVGFREPRAMFVRPSEVVFVLGAE